MKDFLIQTVKFAVMLAIIVIASVAVYKGVEKLHRQFALEAALSIPKTWNKITLPSMENAQASLMTKLQEGFLSYQFELKGYPAALTEPSSTQCVSSHKFVITFLDKNGFKVLEQEIMLSDAKQIDDASGKPIGLSVKGNSHQTTAVYAKAAAWDVVWVP